VKTPVIATLFGAVFLLGVSGYGGHSSAVSLAATQHPSPEDGRQQAAVRGSRSALWSRQQQWVKYVSRCIREHESINAGHYDAQNRTSSASGAYQFIDSTWRHYAAHVPSARKYKRAVDAPAVVQDRVFLKAVKWNGLGHWAGTHCPGTGE
jgi:hypothetical protein